MTSGQEWAQEVIASRYCQGRYYIASPYSHDDGAVMQQRYWAVCKFVGHMEDVLGVWCYSPICHYHGPATAQAMRKDFERWRTRNYREMARCDAMIVLRLPGWANSVGIAAEIERANQLKLDIRFEDPIDDEPQVAKVDGTGRRGDGVSECA